MDPLPSAAAGTATDRGKTAALIAVLWTQMERLLLLVGQKPTLAVLSGKYLVWILPSLFACESRPHRPHVPGKRPSGARLDGR